MLRNNVTAFENPDWPLTINEGPQKQCKVRSIFAVWSFFGDGYKP